VYKSARSDGTFSRVDFVFDQERNIYICPGGAELTSTGNIDQGYIVYYRASQEPSSFARQSGAKRKIYAQREKFRSLTHLGYDQRCRAGPGFSPTTIVL
jgi:hypothetical protein